MPAYNRIKKNYLVPVAHPHLNASVFGNSIEEPLKEDGVSSGQWLNHGLPELARGGGKHLYHISTAIRWVENQPSSEKLGMKERECNSKVSL